jgi:hypothetical protein
MRKVVEIPLQVSWSNSGPGIRMAADFFALGANAWREIRISPQARPIDEGGAVGRCWRLVGRGVLTQRSPHRVLKLQRSPSRTSLPKPSVRHFHQLNWKVEDVPYC